MPKPTANILIDRHRAIEELAEILHDAGIGLADATKRAELVWANLGAEPRKTDDDDSNDEIVAAVVDVLGQWTTQDEAEITAYDYVELLRLI